MFIIKVAALRPIHEVIFIRFLILSSPTGRAREPVLLSSILLRPGEATARGGTGAYAHTHVCEEHTRIGVDVGQFHRYSYEVMHARNHARSPVPKIMCIKAKQVKN